MKLKLKTLKWSAGIPVVMLSPQTASEIGVHVFDRINLKYNKKNISAIVDTIGKIVSENEVAVSLEVQQQLNIPVGTKVDITLLPPIKSLDYIKKKLSSKILSEKEIFAIIQDIVDNSLSEPEIALFISAMYKQGMNMNETISLIKAIVATGQSLKFKSKFVVDKHSIGGIPGNRTTPIVVSICAAAGLIMPKTSSRAITTSAGTADVIESIAKVDFNSKEIKKIISKTNGCLVWGGSLGLVPADSKIIQIEKQLKIDPESQLLASIMAKKIALGAKHIVIDIPFGKYAKVSKQKALLLKQKFEYLGKHFRKNLKVVLTDGSKPMGSGVGPVLELEDVILVLDPTKKGPQDLEEKSLMLAGILLEMTKKSKKGEGISFAREILNSGKAFEKFKQIINAQGGKVKIVSPGKFKKDILAKSNLRVKEINNKIINSLARVAGCPTDKRAGLKIYVSTKSLLKKGDRILTIYAQSKSRLNQAIQFYLKEKPIKF